MASPIPILVWIGMKWVRGSITYARKNSPASSRPRPLEPSTKL